MANPSRFTVVSPDFMKSYDHAHPSGHGHPACKRHRLANIGLDCREDQSPVDLNLLTDRTYTYVCETSDDGWLIGGGEDAKLKRPDTAHAEIWRFGPDNDEHGGIPFATVEAILAQIAFAPITLKPLRVNFTPTSELELLCAYEPDSVIGQLFGLLSDVLACPCGDYGNPFHITMARGVKFRSDALRDAYFAETQKIVDSWKQQFPDGLMFNDGGIDLFESREVIRCHYPPRLTAGIEADPEQLRALRR
ncbi:MAG: hypothetical protein AAF637_14830 [Pseudomonadota bacterium]